MIAVISPAKSLDFETPYHGVHTLPRLLDNTKEMVATMSIKNADELANMMGRVNRTWMTDRGHRKPASMRSNGRAGIRVGERGWEVL